MPFSAMESSQSMRAFLLISTIRSVEIAKAASLLQVTPSFKQLSQYDVWPFSSI